MAVKKAVEAEIQILKVQTGRVRLCILGRTPLIMNSMSAKSMRDLLLPKGRKTTAEKASTLKHDPLSEFVNSMYRDPQDDSPTRLYMPPSAFKGAAKTAALDLPGARKSEVGRLLWVNGQRVPIWGIPRLFMTIVRSADMAKTPDVRTRAMINEWCAEIEVEFNMVKLRTPSVLNLMAAAGITSGVGDFRQEKGAGSFGQFELVEPDDKRYLALQKEAGRAEQDAAIESPEAVDAESFELLSWYQEEVLRRNG